MKSRSASSPSKTRSRRPRRRPSRRCTPGFEAADDHRRHALTTAQRVAKDLGIDEVAAEVSPKEKLLHVYQARGKDRHVAFAGDGINDAPALAAADVGIAMGTGTEVAIQSAAVTLVKGDLRALHQAFALSRATMQVIRQNLWFAFLYNGLGIPLAAGISIPHRLAAQSHDRQRGDVAEQPVRDPEQPAAAVVQVRRWRVETCLFRTTRLEIMNAALEEPTAIRHHHRP
jgi:hypothetical protein